MTPPPDRMFDANIRRIRSGTPGVVRINTRRANGERAMSGRAWMIGRAAASVVAVALLVTAVAMAARGLTVVTSPNPPAANVLGALVAPSPSEIWAVGESTSPSYSGCHGRPLAGRWNGTGFAEVKSTTAICASVNGAAASSASDIWAVGSINDGRDVHIRHYDGTSWSTVAGATIPSPPPGRRLRTTGLFGASALSPSDVWVVGKAEFDDFSRHTVTEHFDGSSWTLVPSPADPGSELMDVDAAAHADAWAVGSSGAGTLAIHWNGAAWSKVPTPNAEAINELDGVSMASSSDVWAVGSSIKNPNDGVSVSHTLIEHWNGSRWKLVPAPTSARGTTRCSRLPRGRSPMPGPSVTTTT
jgi:hypothetical protein